MKWSIPEKVIERGRTYVNEDRVLSVTPDKKKMCGTQKYWGQNCI